MNSTTDVTLVFSTLIGENTKKDTIDDIKDNPNEDDIDEVASTIALFRGGSNSGIQKITKITEDIA